MSLDKIANPLYARKLGLERLYQYNLSSLENGWLHELLEELEEDVDEEEALKNPEARELLVELRLEKLFSNSYREHFFLRAKINGTYLTHCSRCLELMKETLDVEFSCCVLPAELEDTPEFKEVDTILCRNQELDVYFYENGQLDLKEILHEIIFLNINNLPLHQEDCKGLCGECGVNLNKENCSHKNS